MSDQTQQPTPQDDPDVRTDEETGDSIVTLPPENSEDTEQAVKDHFANIVEEVNQSRLQTIIVDLLDLIEKDNESFKKRMQKNAEALQRTGLGDDAPGGATFTGASRVVHPGLLEAAIDGSSRIMKEIFPANGPVKEKIIGDVTADKFKKAERKTKYMNWQLTQKIRGARGEFEQALPQTCLSGVTYMEVTYNEELERPDIEYIPGDEMRLPFAATNYYTAERKTRVMDMTEFKFQRNVKSGLFVDIDMMVSSIEPEQSEPQKAAAKIQGKSASAYNEDGVRRVFKTQCRLDIEEDGDFRPYIIYIDEQSRNSPALYRNWEEDDEKQIELEWVVELPFVPFRGAYPIGLIHMIGGLSAGATGALRALLDSAHINNMPTALKLKGGDRGGQSQQLNPTQVNEIEGTIQTDDIRKTYMPLPFNPPSPVLFQLLGFLVEAAQGVVRTTYEDLAENATNMPVGTTQALIEQGMVVFNAIHGRMHDAMGRILEILHRVNKMYLNDEEVVEELGDLMVSREDFEGPMDVIPVSDPNIFSDVQRTAQMQMVVARSDAHPELYQPLEVEKMLLERTKIPNPERLLKQPPKLIELNAVNENLAIVMGRPVTVFPEQDHVAHIKTLIGFTMSPVLGQAPLIAPRFLPAAMKHLGDHLAYWYVAEIFKETSAAVGKDISTFMGSKDPVVEQKMDDLLETASAKVVEKAKQLFGELQPVMQQLQGTLQQLQQAMQPQDPSATAQAKVQQARAQADMAEQAQRVQMDKQKAAADHMFKIQDAARKFAQDRQSDKEKADQEFTLRMAELEKEHEARMAEIALQADRDDRQSMMDHHMNIVEIAHRLRQPAEAALPSR